MLCALIFVALAAIFVLWVRKKHQFWTERGVPQPSLWALLGTNLKLLMRQVTVPDMVLGWYDMNSSARCYGMYQLTAPRLVIRDPALIKQITIKDFDHFMDHRGVIPDEGEPIFKKNLISLKGQKWKEMRSTLSPAFTSSKMKYFFTQISKNAQQFTNYIVKKEEDLVTLDLRDTFRRFTNDVIASMAFGIECDSLKDPNNEVYLMGKELSDFTSFTKIIKFFIFNISKTLYKLLKIRFFSLKVCDFFTRIVQENIASREKHQIVRPDMIHLLMEARKHGLKHEEMPNLPEAGYATVDNFDLGTKHREDTELTDEDIAAQAFLFFLGGFETVSQQMCFLAHELAVHPDIQQKLQEEILSTLDKCQNNLTYEALMEMKYLDMVVSESLRLWPNALALDRECTKEYTIQPELPNENPILIRKDEVLVIPVFGLHRDPQYYPNPEHFDPERFNDENKKNIQPYTYLPFGSGPRNCIGSRFALLDLKTLFFYLIANFELVPVERTQIPLKFSKTSLNITPENGFWLGFKRRGQ